jgi:maltose/maltodextrin transport system permease protein
VALVAIYAIFEGIGTAGALAGHRDPRRADRGLPGRRGHAHLDHQGLLRDHPAEIEENAKVDGATHWQAFRLVLLPMAVPILMVVFVLAFIGTIIEYPVASILLREEPNLTLAVGSKFYLYEQKYLWGDFAAAAVLSGLPITLVFLPRSAGSSPA